VVVVMAFVCDFHAVEGAGLRKMTYVWACSLYDTGAVKKRGGEAE
jgi:hypothetical protein